MITEALGLLAFGVLFQVGTRAALVRGFRAPRTEHTVAPNDLGLPAREARIATANGKQMFAWLIPAPDGKPAPAILVMHGWGANAALMLPSVRPLHDAGYTVLLIDARCHGRSDDDEFASMPRFAEDIAYSLDWLKRQPEADPERIGLIGHSVGAGAALLAASRRHDIRAVVAISAFAHPREVMRRMLAHKHLPYRPVGWYVLRRVEHAIGHRFDDIAPISTVTRVDCPILLAHGRQDDTVPYSDAERLLAAGSEAGRSIRLLPLEGDHEPDDELLKQSDVLLGFLNRACMDDTGTEDRRTM